MPKKVVVAVDSENITFTAEKGWKPVHDWSGKAEEWTEKMMADELKAVAGLLRKMKRKQKLSEFVQKIREEVAVFLPASKKAKLPVNKLVDFTALIDVFDSWERATVYCKHYGRIWLAQDESYLSCLKQNGYKWREPCDGKKLSGVCRDYEPVVRANAKVADLAKQISVWGVS